MENLISKISETLKYWWIGVLLGVLFLLLGFWVIQSPIESFVTFAIYFAITYIISGMGAIVFSISNREVIDGWGWQLAGGILELILGIALLTNPGVSMIALAFFVGFWLLFRGISTISISLDLKRNGGSNWSWVLFSGILTAILAFMVLVNPLYAISTLSIFVGLSLIMAGIAAIMVGFQIRKVSKKVKETI